MPRARGKALHGPKHPQNFRAFGANATNYIGENLWRGEPLRYPLIVFLRLWESEVLCTKRIMLRIFDSFALERFHPTNPIYRSFVCLQNWFRKISMYCTVYRKILLPFTTRKWTMVIVHTRMETGARIHDQSKPKCVNIIGFCGKILVVDMTEFLGHQSLKPRILTTRNVK